MAIKSKHVSIWIDRPAAAVYDFAVQPENLPQWASGLGSSVEAIDGTWVAESPMGTVTVAFMPRNEFGVLDHDVTLPSGDTVRNPLRVIAGIDGIVGGAGCEVDFTVRQLPGVSDDDFAADQMAVQADLAKLKQVLEGASG